MNSRELAGRVALVTGVSRRRGIGAAIARELGRAGARLFVTFFRRYDEQQAWSIEPDEPESLMRELGSAADDIEALELDLSQPGAPSELFRQARQRFGRIDILVNNAAHWEAVGIKDVRPDQLHRHHAVNVLAPVMLCGEFVRQARRHPCGRIINLTSGQGHGPMPGQIAYVVTKAALDALTTTLNAELAGRGITVNAIDPGPTDTGWITTAAQREAVLRASPTGTISSPAEIARLVRRLARDDAASITGQIIRAHAGDATFSSGPGRE